MMNPGTLLNWAAKRFSRREAIIDRERRFRFVDVHRRSNQIANALIHHGLVREGRVAKLMNNCAELIEIQFAAAKAGGASVNLHARGAAAEHVHMLNDSETDFLFVDEAHREQVSSILDGCAQPLQVIGIGWEDEGVASYHSWLEGASDRDLDVQVEQDSLFHLHYTSGTTGKAKAVVNTHRTHRAWMSKFFMNLEYRLGVEDSMLHVAPLTHAAFNYIETYFVRGARNIILPSFDPELFFDTLERERATTTFWVPTMIPMILACEKRGKADLSSLHTICYGASPIAEEVLRRAIEEFGPIFRQHYGLTEARQPLTLLLPDEHVTGGSPEQTRRLASCGRPVHGVSFALLDDQDHPVPTEEIGEICVRGDHAMTGYWENEEATAEAIRSGWVHTGDLARMDEEGHVYIVDRKKDLIISGGFNIYPREVENAICRHPGVHEAVVFGVPDEKWGEAVNALVALKEGHQLTVSDVQEFYGKEIAGFRRPKHVEFIIELPKNSRGKIMRKEIRDLYWKNMPRNVN